MITKEQWWTILVLHLGLRSEDNQETIKGNGASYAMDKGLEIKNSHPFYPDIPSDWEELLHGTIKLIKGFQNSSDRYLLIVDNSVGNSEESEYLGTFPKCSAKAGRILASTSLDQDEATLVGWVLRCIECIRLREKQ